MTDKKEEGGAAGQSAGTPPIMENLFGAEVYADDASFFSLKQGNLSICFVSSRYDNNDGGKLKLVTVGRLVMPVAAAQRLAQIHEAKAAFASARAQAMGE